MPVPGQELSQPFHPLLVQMTVEKKAARRDEARIRPRKVPFAHSLPPTKAKVDRHHQILNLMAIPLEWAPRRCGYPASDKFPILGLSLELFPLLAAEDLSQRWKTRWYWRQTAPIHRKEGNAPHPRGGY